MAVVLNAEGVRKSFSDTQVLVDLELRVEAGSLLGLVGRNGAGKSTFLDIAVGLQAPDAGSVELFGTPTRLAPDSVLERMAYVAQNQFPFPELSPLVYLDFVGSHYPKFRRDLARALVKRLDIPHGHAMGRLSPGVRQRVEVVRALAIQPELMLLDEPVSAMDAPGRRQVIAELLNVAMNQGTAVLLTTHVLADVEQVSAELAILSDGRIRKRESVSALKSGYVRLESRLPERPEFLGRAGFVQPLPEGGWIAVLKRTELPESLPEGIHCQEPNLEDLFIELLA